jgi:ornithine cyclodeaminase/thiomorpholine-carboxylate dehydrogenase
VDVLVLTREDVEGLLEPLALLDALADSFAALSAGAFTAPPRSEVAVPSAGIVLGMPGWRPGAHVTVKLVSVFEGNPARGLPSHVGLIAALDPETGLLRCLLDGTALTALRTAGAAALSVRLLARPGARVAAVVGAGVQAAAHLRMLSAVLPRAELRVAARRPEAARALAAGHPGAVAVEAGVEAAVRGAEVVCLATASPAPVLDPAWLAPGAHVTSVGYVPPGGELPRELAARGPLFVETRAAFAPPPVGCAELAGLDPAEAVELGEVVAGTRPGRRTPQEVTVYKSMGHVAEDLAAAELVQERARSLGVGRTIEL